ncbi:hypothetical protein TNCV_3905341 [Trichonephila clavipes]|nr:hypothetical protein TNCV_3905341 [Trichonephila clavipes]
MECRFSDIKIHPAVGRTLKETGALSFVIEDILDRVRDSFCRSPDKSIRRQGLLAKSAVIRVGNGAVTKSVNGIISLCVSMWKKATHRMASDERARGAEGDRYRRLFGLSGQGPDLPPARTPAMGTHADRGSQPTLQHALRRNTHTRHDSGRLYIWRLYLHNDGS